jgi:hypothetical protein
MKRLFLVMALATLLACQPAPLDKPCYVCITYTTDSPPLTEQVCGRADMEQYRRDQRAKPETALVSCTNR